MRLVRDHIADDRFLDVLVGDAAADERQHLEECASCRETLAEVRGGFLLARDADVPEPPPLYWETFRARLQDRLPREGRVRRWGLPAAAAAVLLVGLGVLTLSPPAGPGPEPAAAVLPAWSALPPEEDDDALPLLAALDASEELAPTACGDVAACVLGLTEEEGEEVASGLTFELKGRSL